MHTRREVLGGLAAAAAGAALGVSGQPHARAEEPAPEGAPRRQPVLFVGHGSPMLAVDATRGEPFAAWGGRIGRPTAVLMVSAHWERRPITLGATTTRPLVYDFGGFPRSLSQVKYPAPGAPELGSRIERMLAPAWPVRRDESRGLDHGAWTPLVWMYRDADVPVLQVSLPTSNPQALVKLGRALRPLRDEGVLVVGSGNMTHNLRRTSRSPTPPAWAAEFDAWAAEALRRHDVDALADFERKAPAARMNHPTVEHYTPLLVAAGASHTSDPVTFPITGWDGGSLSRRSVQLG